MKKYSLITHFLSLACAGLIAGCFTGWQISGAISALSCQSMARTWEALPRAETTTVTCRQASTALPRELIPIRAGSARGERP